MNPAEIRAGIRAWADYERRNRFARLAYREDELTREGICIRCEVRVNDGGRHRYCGSCRNRKARERKP